MRAESIKFMRKILSGNVIENCAPLAHKPAYMGRKITVKPGTLLDDMGIKDIYCDKVGGANSGWLHNIFSGNRSIFITGKHHNSPVGCSYEINLPQRNNENAFAELRNFFETLYKFRK